MVELESYLGVATFAAHRTDSAVSSVMADRIRSILAISILLFLLGSVFVPQYVSLVSTCMAWSVWLSLDPWIWPWRRHGATIFDRKK